MDIMNRAKNCQLCGDVWFNLDNHHYIPVARHPDPADQRIIRLCRFCHSDTHSLNNSAFQKKYGVKRSLFLKCKEII